MVQFFCSLCAIDWCRVSKDKMYKTSSPEIPHRQPHLYQQTCVSRGQLLAHQHPMGARWMLQPLRHFPV